MSRPPQYVKHMTPRGGSQTRRTSQLPISPQGTEKSPRRGGKEITCRVVPHPRLTWDLHDPVTYIPLRGNPERAICLMEVTTRCLIGIEGIFSSPFVTNCQLRLPQPLLPTGAITICGVTTTKSTAIPWPNVANLNVSCINWPMKESFPGSSTGGTTRREEKQTEGRGIKDADPPKGKRRGAKVPTHKGPST